MSGTSGTKRLVTKRWWYETSDTRRAAYSVLWHFDVFIAIHCFTTRFYPLFHSFSPSVTNNTRWEALCSRVFRPSLSPSVNIYFAFGDFSLLRGQILMKLATYIHHVSGHCAKGFQGQRSKVKVIARLNALWRRRHISTVWRWVQLFSVIIHDKRHV